MPTVTQSPPLLPPVTKDDIGALQVCLPPLKIVSFRGPGQSGGVSSSLEPIVRQLGVKVRWIALHGVPANDDTSATGFEFHVPEIPQRLLAEHEHFALAYLWPLFHSMPERGRFDQEQWRAFRQASELVATKVLRIAEPSFPTLIWLHDYHMALVAPMLSMQAGVLTCQFWHVPWPAAETLAASPAARDIVESLLANRVIGFHTSGYAANFMDTVEAVCPTAAIDRDAMQVSYQRQTTRIVVMPLGLDFAYWQRLAHTSRANAAAIPKNYMLASQVILGVDRLDYSKGVLEKLAGLERFLENNPGWHRRFHYVQLAQSPQSAAPPFQSYAVRVRERVDQINRAFHLDGWSPIVWRAGQVDQAELSAWYQAADVLAVTPLRDGLNLIAKEYVACRHDEQGCLVLSDKTGCAAELATGAIIVDPGEPDSIAEAFAQALAMGVEEKRRRMHSMRHVVGWNQLHDWACGFLRQVI